MSDPIVEAINQQKLKVKQYIIPTLEDFIYLCYPELNIADDKFNDFIVNEGNLTKQVSELEYQLQFNPFDFKQFVIQSHCEENLDFLVDIHRYELLWNKKFNDNSNYLSCYPKRVFINESEFNNFKNKRQCFPIDLTSINNKNIDNNTDNNNNNSNKNNNNNNTNNNNNNDDSKRDNDNNNDKDSDNDNNSNNGINNESNQDSSVDDLNSIRDLSLDSDDSVSAFWSHIINLYIRDTSLNQINIPSEILQSILTEDKKPRLHKPKVLLTAKKLILSLLRQNVYWEFIRSVQSKIERHPTLHGPCGVSNNSSSNVCQIFKGNGPESLLDNWNSVYLCQHKLNKEVKKPTGFFRFYAKNSTDQQHNKNSQTSSTVNLSPITNTISNSSSILSQATSPSSLTIINSNSNLNKINIDKSPDGNNLKHKKGLFSSSLSKLSKIRSSHRPSLNSNSSSQSSSHSFSHHYSPLMNHSSPSQSITISPPRYHTSDSTNQYTPSRLQTRTQTQSQIQNSSPGGSPIASPNFYTTTASTGAFKLCTGQSDKDFSSSESIRIPRKVISEPKEYILDKGKFSKDKLTQDVKKFRS